MIRRNTIQCALALETVNKLKDHATADEVYLEIAKAQPHISRGTVYRNLNRLTQEGKIRRIEVPNGADRFDHNCAAHYHVRCESCGRVFDVDMDCIHDLDKRIRDAHGFQFTGCDVLFSGVCPDCLARDDAAKGGSK